MPGAGRTSRSIRPRRRAGTTAQHGGHARIKRIFNLLRANPMDMGINAACGDNIAFTGNHLGPRTDNDIDTGLNIGVTSLADPGDTAITNTDIGLDDAGIIKDQCIGDDSINRALGPCCLRLAHAIADHLATAKFDFFTKRCEIFFDLDQKIGIGKTHTVANSRAKHRGIGGTINFISHFYAPSLPLILPLKP